jgi:hypothetical protein
VDYRSLNLSAPQLSSPPLFVGNPGNTGDPETYQSQSPNIVVNANQAVLDYVAARKAAASKASGTNYFEVVSTSLAATYGSLNPPQPAVVVITDSSLKLATPLTGFGILIVPNDFEINAALNWTGIVVVQPAAGMSDGKFIINAGGSVNGALILQASNLFTLTTSSASASFKITYSCDAIDAAMGSRPLKIVSQTETSY